MAKRFLLTNDDGIEALGLKTLESSLNACGEIITLAPDVERSSTGHGITLSRPLRLKEHGSGRYSCDGLPADCTLLGLGHFYHGNFPDAVISGINHGANLGQDRYYSGTMAAAREASMHGVPGIAVSLVLGLPISGNSENKDQVKHFETAGALLRSYVDSECFSLIPYHCIANINVPNLPLSKVRGVKITFPGKRRYLPSIEKRFDRRGGEYYWIGGIFDGDDHIEGSDCQSVADGFVSLTCYNVMNQEEKHQSEFQEMKKRWEKHLDI